MTRYFKISFCVFLIVVQISACRGKIKQTKDTVYSRHLQEHVELSIITTPMPADKGGMNLLLLNDGQDIEKLRIREIIDSLYSKDLIEPTIIVGILANNRMQEYGVAGRPDYRNNGGKADKYSAFVDNELYSFVKKKAGVRKFKSVIIAGCSLGGLSAFDIAWNNADKIDKAGIFSGSFWWRDRDANSKDYSEETDRIMLSALKSSRKKPKVKYWFYAGAREEVSDRDKDGVIDVIDDTKDVISIIREKNIIPTSDIVYTEAADGTHDYRSWSNAFPSFLIWAVGK
jgi:predicted alpha/beta superfamily hydrolase